MICHVTYLSTVFTEVEKKHAAAKEQEKGNIEQVKDSMVTSTPLKERSEELVHQVLERAKRPGDGDVESLPEVKSSKELFSEEAKLILNTTPELNEQANVEDFDTEKNLSTIALSKPCLSVEELMVSQLSLDSSRLGHLQEQRRVAAPSLATTGENGSSINDLSLFAELSSEEPSLMNEMESASCLSSVGKELEGLIKENEELLSSK